MKKSFFIFLFFLSGAFALEFNVSPKGLEYNGSKNEWICNEINVLLSEEYDVEINSRWTIKETRNILDYNRTNEDVNILFNCSKIDDTRYKICFKSKYIVEKNGVVLIRVINSSVGIGIWTKLNIEDKRNNILLFSKEGTHLKKAILSILILILIIEVLFLIVIKFKKYKFN